MRRVALTVRAEAMEPVLDHLLPRIPHGVHPTEVDDGVELAVYGRDLPPLAELEALAGDALVRSDEQEAPTTRSSGAGGSSAVGRSPGASWCGRRIRRPGGAGSPSW